MDVNGVLAAIDAAGDVLAQPADAAQGLGDALEGARSVLGEQVRGVPGVALGPRHGLFVPVPLAVAERAEDSDGDHGRRRHRLPAGRGEGLRRQQTAGGGGCLHRFHVRPRYFRNAWSRQMA